MSERHEPTEKTRNLAKTLAGLGLPQENICSLIGVSLPTLNAHYRSDMLAGVSEANAKISQTLFQKAMSGDTASLIFWTKVRMKWSERQIIEHQGAGGGPIQTVDLTRASDEQLAALAALFGPLTGEPDVEKGE